SWSRSCSKRTRVPCSFFFSRSSTRRPGQRLPRKRCVSASPGPWLPRKRDDSASLGHHLPRKQCVSGSPGPWPARKRDPLFAAETVRVPWGGDRRAGRGPGRLRARAGRPQDACDSRVLTDNEPVRRLVPKQASETGAYTLQAMSLTHLRNSTKLKATG